MGKLYDVAVVVGTYQQNGKEKFKWKTVGAMIEGKGGKQYIMLDRTFNPAGVPDLGSDQIVMSLFTPKGSESSSRKPSGYKAPDVEYGEDDEPF